MCASPVSGVRRAPPESGNRTRSFSDREGGRSWCSRRGAARCARRCQLTVDSRHVSAHGKSAVAFVAAGPTKSDRAPLLFFGMDEPRLRPQTLRQEGPSPLQWTVALTVILSGAKNHSWFERKERRDSSRTKRAQNDDALVFPHPAHRDHAGVFHKFAKSSPQRRLIFEAVLHEGASYSISHMISCV